MTQLENIDGVVYVRFPGGLKAAFVLDPANSSPELLAAVGGGQGASSGSARITVPLTGGSDGCLVVQDSPTTCVDAHPFMKAVLRAQPLLLKVQAGEYYRLEGLLPMPFTAAQAAARPSMTVALTAKVAGRNWRAFSGGVPADIDPTLDPRTMYVEIGSVFAEGLLFAAPRPAEGDNSAEVAPNTFSEDFSRLAAGAAPPPELLRELWAPAGQTLAYDATNKRLSQVVTDTNRRALAYVPAGQFVGGRVRVVSSLQGNNVNKQIRAILGASGGGVSGGVGTNTQNGWVAQLDSTGALSLYAYVNGALQQNSTVQALTLTGNLPLNAQYAVEIDRDDAGTTVQARAYAVGDPVPAWQRTNSSGVQRAPGYAAFVNHGSGDGGRSSYHSVAVVVGAGELP